MKRIVFTNDMFHRKDYKINVSCTYEQTSGWMLSMTNKYV